MASPIDAGGPASRPRVPITVDVFSYSSLYGVGSWWEEGAEIRAEVWEAPERTAVISGNSAGLRSLARHLLMLAQDEVPDGNHLDFDSYCGWLKEGSIAIRIEVEKD